MFDLNLWMPEGPLLVATRELLCLFSGLAPVLLVCGRFFLPTRACSCCMAVVFPVGSWLSSCFKISRVLSNFLLPCPSLLLESAALVVEGLRLAEFLGEPFCSWPG